jgi:hypothetical protein
MSRSSSCQPHPQPQHQPCPPPDHSPCDPHAALVSADVNADVHANLLSNCNLVDVGAHIGLDIDIGHHDFVSLDANLHV